MQCCGTAPCEVTKDEFVCQSLKLLPDYQGKMKPDGNYFGYYTALVEAFFECVVESACALEKEFNPCTAELYTECWADEFDLPFFCPIEGFSDELIAELYSLQLCLQVQLSFGATFNQALLDQIAAVLEIEYTVTIPTYNPEGVPICDVVPLPAAAGLQCNPNGCVFIQSFIIDVTCAPTDAHIEVFKCYIEQLNPCHVVYCVRDMTPKAECLPLECEPTVAADCVTIDAQLLDLECEAEVLV